MGFKDFLLKLHELHEKEDIPDVKNNTDNVTDNSKEDDNLLRLAGLTAAQIPNSDVVDIANEPIERELGIWGTF